MAKKQEVCTGCKDRFFADDEDDMVEGLYYCSYCQEKECRVITGRKTVL